MAEDSRMVLREVSFLFVVEKAACLRQWIVNEVDFLRESDVEGENEFETVTAESNSFQIDVE